MVVVPEALHVCQGKLQALTGAGVKGHECCDGEATGVRMTKPLRTQMVPMLLSKVWALVIMFKICLPGLGYDFAPVLPYPLP